MIKELYNWIKLFFWLRKKENDYYPETRFYETYSDEFTGTIRMATGYNEQSIPTMWVLLNNLIGSIENYHEWRNKNGSPPPALITEITIE